MALQFGDAEPPAPRSKQNRDNLSDALLARDESAAIPPPVAIALVPASPQIVELSSGKDEEPASDAAPSRAPSPAPSATRRIPTRAEIREMAVKQQGGVMGERARGLAQLHRAEQDLILTGWTVSILGISFAVLSMWVAINIHNFVKMP